MKKDNEEKITIQGMGTDEPARPATPAEILERRVSIIKEKFSRSDDFDKKGRDNELLKIILSTLERALTDVIISMKPIKVIYDLKQKQTARNEIDGKFELQFQSGDIYRECVIRFWISLEAEFIVEIHGKKKEIKRFKYPVDADPEIIKEDLAIHLANNINDILPG